MTNKLEPILRQKYKEVEALYQTIAQQPEHTLVKILQNKFSSQSVISFKQALKIPGLTVIAEIKRQSPSKGMLASIPHPCAFAKRYILSGAHALSVLTDKLFFNGSLQDLIQVTNIARKYNIPVLRKDFIINEIQIAEAVLAGANAI